jgi:hypothetical protein
MKNIRSTFCALFVVIVFSGCAGINSRSPLDPSQGWRRLQSQDPSQLDTKIREDYLDYISKLPPKKSSFLGAVFLFENGKGSRAVTFERGANGRYQCHVLFYDQYNKRTKVIKYACGGYRS